ncbi:hypothetical protein BDW71DRAFT_205266 [Aspergillus fruticulosus]
MREIARNVTFIKSLPTCDDAPAPEGISITTPPGSPSPLCLRAVSGIILHDIMGTPFPFDWHAGCWDGSRDLASIPGPLREKVSQELFWNAILGFGYSFLNPSQIKAVEGLLDKGVNINQLHPKSKVAGLQLALHRGRQDMAKFLLERGAAAEAPARFGVGTPLREAIKHDYTEIIEMIPDQGVDVNAAPPSEVRGRRFS